MEKSGNKIHFYEFGKFRLDVTNRELLKDGKHVPLTQKSFELLEFLVENRGRGLRKNEILNDIWTESFVEEANLAQHIYMVRKALKDYGDSESYIETIPKYGYRFIGEVTEQFVESPAIGQALTEKDPADSNGFHKDSTPVFKTERERNTADEPDQRPASNPARLRGSKIIAASAITLLVVVLAAYFFFFRTGPAPHSGEIKSIAILPFSQIGDNPDEKLGLGLADTLISRLGNQDEIAISPTSTIIKFLESGTENPIDIGEKLGVDAILTGTIQRENDNVRVNVQLINVKDKTPKWSDKFDAKFSNIFSLQDRVSEQVAERLSLTLSEPRDADKVNKYTENIEAYQAYTLGLFYWDKRTKESLAKAVEYFEKATEKDPKFSTAYALAADSYSLIGYFRHDVMPTTEAIGKARELAKKALELDPRSSEALTALGVVALYEKKSSEAIPLFRKALQIKPNNATARQRLAWMLTTKGESLEEAVAEMRLAQKADPLSLNTNLNLTRLLRLSRKPDEALEFCNRALEIDPSSTSAKIFLAEIYEQKGDLDKAYSQLESVLSESPDDAASTLILSRISAKNGEKKKARELLDKSLAIEGVEFSAYELATAYLFLGEKQRAIAILKSAKQHTLIHFLHIKHDPNIDEIRKLPAYAEILKVAEESLDTAYK